MTPEMLRIGSRGSDLALWQARWVKADLERIHPGILVDITIIKTTGDKVLDAPLSMIGDKGLFTREIELALLNGSIDIAVHSLKDLPTELPDGLMLGAVCEREDPRDVFIPHPKNPVRTLREQPQGAHIATGSLRRKCQLHHLRPDIDIIDIRGNLATRFKKLEESDWHGMMLARAGVIRLGWEARIGEAIAADVILPAVGQGALGIEVRSSESKILRLLAGLIHDPTLRAVLAERSLLRKLEGGCQVPIGTFARLNEDGSQLLMDAIVGSIDGRTIVRKSIKAESNDPEGAGVRLAEQLLADGADRILQEIRTGTRNGASVA
jgi:hydroxymethylbilane synthase